MLIKLIESELPVDCHFAFTVQEEVGTRGVFGAAFQNGPGTLALVVEGDDGGRPAFGTVHEEDHRTGAAAS